MRRRAWAAARNERLAGGVFMPATDRSLPSCSCDALPWDACGHTPQEAVTRELVKDLVDLMLGD